MKLIIVESPNKCATIGHYVGSDYKVMASQGHIRDLSMKGKGGLGIDVEKGFVPDFVISPKKAGIVKELEKAKKSADEVILATDPDREGEAISWHLAQVLHLDIATTKRLQFHEITKPAILDALANPKHIDMNLVNSQETRRMYDRVIGFKLSSLLQKKMGSQSAGRVQSVTLKMIIDVELSLNGKKVSASLDKIDGKTAQIHSKEEAEAVLARLAKSMELVSLTSA